MEKGFIQIGETALRDPITGNYLPSVPLYIKADINTLVDKRGITHTALHACEMMRMRVARACEKRKHLRFCLLKWFGGV